MSQRFMTMTAIGALVASMAVVGCSKQDQSNAKAKADDAVAQINEKARELGNDTKMAARDATQDVKNATKNTGEAVGDKVSDAVITSSVKAELMKDSSLSAMKINVDTDNGRVALRGSAPNSNARERATTLASAVKGVTGVDNELRVEPAKN